MSSRIGTILLQVSGKSWTQGKCLGSCQQIVQRKPSFSSKLGFSSTTYAARSLVPLNPYYLLPLSGELGDLGGWLCIGSV